MEGPEARAFDFCSIFKFTLPKTLAVKFPALFSGVGAETLHALTGVQQRRDEMIAAFENGVASNEACKKIEDYLPYLHGMLVNQHHFPAAVHQNMRLSWKTPFTAQYRESHFAQNHFFWEAAMVLVGYTVMLRNNAAEQLAKAQSSADSFEKAVPEIRKQLLLAASVVQFLQEKWMVQWANKPPVFILEMKDEFLKALFNLCLAEAGALKIKLALQKNLSFGTVAKLCQDVHNKFEYIGGMLKDEKIKANLPVKLYSYVNANTILFEVLAKQYYAEHRHSEGGYGESVAYYQEALKQMPDWKDKHYPEMDSGWSEKWKERKTFLKKAAEKLEKDNTVIYFDAVPKKIGDIEAANSAEIKDVFALPIPLDFNVVIDKKGGILSSIFGRK